MGGRGTIGEGEGLYGIASVLFFFAAVFFLFFISLLLPLSG